MNIANLYSLLNSPFLIEQTYGEAHLPLLQNLLSGLTTVEKVEMNHITYFKSENDLDNNSSVAVLSIKSPILKYSQECGPMGTKAMQQELQALANDPSISGVVLDIDSGGGQVSGTAEFYDFLKNYPKPIAAYTDGMMCSAAYYIGAATDHIVANPRMDCVGSIGAYADIVDPRGYYEENGFKLHTIYADKSSEKNSAIKQVFDGDYDEYRDKVLNPIVDTFVSDMKAARPQLSADVFKGATYDAKQSLSLGLIDEIGSLNDAINYVSDKAKESTTTTQKLTHTNDMKDYPQIAALLSLSEPLVSDKDGGTYLAQDFLIKIEDALVGANQKETEASKELTAIESEILEAVKACGIEASANASDSVASLLSKIEELKASDGSTITSLEVGDDPIGGQPEKKNSWDLKALKYGTNKKTK